MKKATLVVLALSSIAGFTTSQAADNLPKFNCTLTDSVSKDGAPGDAKDMYSATTPEIFLVCDSDDVKKGQVVKAAWIAVDTNNAAPANYKIAEKSITVDHDVSNAETWHSNLSLTKPNNGWPLGSYRIDLTVNDAVDKSFNFAVK